MHYHWNAAGMRSRARSGIKPVPEALSHKRVRKKMVPSKLSEECFYLVDASKTCPERTGLLAETDSLSFHAEPAIEGDGDAFALAVIRHDLMLQP